MPYLLLLFAVIVGMFSSVRNAVLVLATAVASGLVIQTLEPVGLMSTLFLGLLIWLPVRLNLKGCWRALSLGIFLVLGLAMSNHLVPGFNNLLIFRGMQFSQDSVPFTMYLNFDKTLVGLFIYLFYLKTNQIQIFTIEILISTAKILYALVILLIPLAFGVQYIRFDLKFPELGWIWMLNNLFFVCLAEEAVFRGFIQQELIKFFPKVKVWSLVSIFLAASMFGLSHYKGGISYIALSTIAGLFYGYAYNKTNRLESPILVHFGLNAIHFLFFSYPALVK